MKKKINERLTELRTLAGLKSGQLANLCNFTAANYSHFEKGRNQLNLENAVLICKKLEPFIGDRFLYLAKEDSSTETEALNYNEGCEGFIHRDNAMKIFRDVVAKSQREGSINVSEKAADDMARHFSMLAGKAAYPDQKKNGSDDS